MSKNQAPKTEQDIKQQLDTMIDSTKIMQSQERIRDIISRNVGNRDNKTMQDFNPSKKFQSYDCSPISNQKHGKKNGREQLNRTNTQRRLNKKSYNQQEFQAEILHNENQSSSLTNSLSKEVLKENLHQIVLNCFSLEKSSKREKSELNRSGDRFNNFYQEYKRFVDFKQEAGWYDNQNPAKETIYDPKFKLPNLSQVKSLSRLSTNPFKNEIGLQIKQEKLDPTEEEDIVLQKRQRVKAYFMRSDLTTAENYFNIMKMKTFEVNHNSVYNFHHQAIKEFNHSQSDPKLINFTKQKPFPMKKKNLLDKI
ncbi:UNKNOWN [Stylonychia lemnae]|uniref:Uncharacterized protein n=1 Tax=Stylonychia lemnae TaxID=5949 RepID=A0A078AUH2_STYLE|nr:UNKNOWN [Stylonychia lemnae]|eukprot:CDW84518.1 UNKNOWN [Stylonychia lemnae]